MSKKGMGKKITALTASVLVMTASSMTVLAAGNTPAPVVKFGFESESEMEVFGGAIASDAERGSVLTLNGGTKGTSYAKADSDVYQNTDWSDGMTISFWVKAAGTEAGIAPLYSFSIADNGSEGYIATTDSLEIAINTDGNSGMAEYPRVWADPSVVDATAVPVLSAGTWQHVAVSLSASGMVIYLDGEVFSEPALGPSSANFKLFMEQIGYSYGLQLGNWNCGWWEEIGSFAGSYDDVYVFNKTLTREEVQTIMAADFSEVGAEGGISIPLVAGIAVVVIVVAGVVVVVLRKKTSIS